jgi:aminoglycoside phosphotransferase family enzyme/predicted kinase
MTIPAAQQDVARFLTGLSGAPPRETHISAVFIGSDTVWKLKKAVRLPFLDFTNADARAHFLRRELELNKQAAPEIYRDVIGICRDTDGTLRLGGDNPVDWVLRMVPIPDGDFLDVIASRGGLTPERQDDLGDAVATYHMRLPPVRDRDGAGTFSRITEGNARSALAAGLPRADVEAWKQRMDLAVGAHRGWLNERATAGYVRRCHGDLHLGNLCLWDGKPVPFDALEFDEALATIDVAYDLAFLLMDLDHRSGRAAANRVMNRYVARTGDIATAGFPIFLSQRAMIRAHVLKAMNQDGTTYLTAARTYLDPVSPVVIAIGGLQGSGKSTLARALAPDLGLAPGALVLRSDEIRKRLRGVPPQSRLPPDAYADAANAATNEAFVEQTKIAAASGHAVIADATFLDTSVRTRISAVANEVGVPFLGVWMDAPVSLLERRILSRMGDASDATVAVLRRSAGNDPGAGDWMRVDASDGSQALNAVRRAVSGLMSAFSG